MNGSRRSQSRIVFGISRFLSRGNWDRLRPSDLSGQVFDRWFQNGIGSDVQSIAANRRS